MIAIHWFRRDLRLEDNTALFAALDSGYKVLPIFIFDEHILEHLPPNDARVSFIHQQLDRLNDLLIAKGSGLLVKHGAPTSIWKNLLQEFDVKAVFTNKDYEPYAIQRDTEIKALLEKNNVEFQSFKDHVIFEENDILKGDGKPYTIYTPYKNQWLKKLNSTHTESRATPNWENLYQETFELLPLTSIGFQKSTVVVRDTEFSRLTEYADTRDIPTEDSTSYLSPHLRFGTVSIRHLVQQFRDGYEVFLSELIWREFFIQILWHFPKVVAQNFKAKYNGIEWRNDEAEFEKWCNGKTGYPIVDAGMRQLNETGYMHNRVRMITASFLCKHLLIDWRWGEAYFAEKLLDFDLASNNGNWQWVAGTGCDSAPYFRVFNPTEQQKKFDASFEYVKKWVPEFGTENYPNPMVEHKMARIRALETYKVGIEST